jgi:nucleotide-binding universal stress UspA family protein
MRILLAIDGSACSDVSVKTVAKRPWPAGSIVKVLSAIEPVTLPVPEAVTIPESWYEATRRAAHADIKRAFTMLKQLTGLQIETVIRIGSPEDVIVQEAEDWHADLIIVGSHGRGRARRFLLGSVSQAVALHARCSVEIVREASDEARSRPPLAS